MPVTLFRRPQRQRANTSGSHSMSESFHTNKPLRNLVTVEAPLGHLLVFHG